MENSTLGLRHIAAMLELVIPENKDNRVPWETDEVKANVATKGFHGVALTLRDVKATAEILTDVFGYRWGGYEPSHCLSGGK